VASAQRLRRSGINIVEYTQSLPNLSAMASNLFELIRSRTLAVFPDEPLRRAAGQAIGIEGARGWKIDKAKQSHRIDPLIALAMAHALRGRGQGRVPAATHGQLHDRRGGTARCVARA
jgi:phage terminase large subunit-like protein